MQYKFLNIFLNKKELLTQSKIEINPFLLENNAAHIEKIYNFYKNPTNLLYVSGFLGTGKPKIVEYSTSFLSPETIVLKYNCFNATVVDDILLAFFSELKNLYSQGVISEPKIKVDSFIEKVNSYFSQIERPFVIILDSFEAVLDENRQEILDFVFHLMSLQKVKVILIARTFESKYFKNVPIERIVISAFDQKLFEKYLKVEKIKYTNTSLEEFYKYTRGYYFFTALSIKIMKHENIALEELLEKYKESFLSFGDFLSKKALGFIAPVDKNLFWFLLIIRHPVSIDLVKKLNFYNEERIKFLIENLVITDDNSQIYVRDPLKDYAYDTIPPSAAQRIHQYIIDLYTTQLPLKPLERDICISRQTMRKEIEYNKLFLPKRPKTTENPEIDINFLSYAQRNDFVSKDKPEEDKAALKETDKKPKNENVDLTQRKNIELNLASLLAQMKPKEPQPKEEPSLVEEETKDMALKEIVRLINKEEFQYKYAKVIELCNKALSLKKDKDYQGYLPYIYVKIAHAYKKNANYDNSLKYYSLAQKLYALRGKFIKANYIKLNIARIFYDTYKFDNAKKLLLEIVAQKDNPNSLKTKAYLQLANLEENLSNPDAAYKYYQSALDVADDSMDTKSLSELYFKYALIMDDKNDVRTASKYYNMCIELSDDFKVNKFISSAYSNIATLYAERNDTINATNNFLKAFEIDKENSNIEGMYYSASKLATLYSKKDSQKALEYFYTALDCAKLTKDVFYIVSAAIALGDYNYDIMENEIALKNYLYAFDLAQSSFSRENLSKIEMRINDMKFKLGVEKFENLVEIIKQGNE